MDELMRMYNPAAGGRSAFEGGRLPDWAKEHEHDRDKLADFLEWELSCEANRRVPFATVGL